MKKMIFVFLYFVVGAVSAADVTEFDTKDLIGVSVSVPSGKVSLEAHDGAKASVVFTKNKFSEHCKLTIEKKDNRIAVKVEKSPRFFSLGDCDANYEIKIPKKADSDLKLGSGNIVIKGLQGELLFSLGSGEVTADGSFPKVDGKAGSGPVHITGLTGSGNLKSGSGSVNLIFSGKPANGAFEIQLGSGDSTLTFPKGSKVKTTFVAGVGKLHNELGDSTDATYLVSVKTGSGNLSIKAH
jgi:hypothetical protein